MLTDGSKGAIRGLVLGFIICGVLILFTFVQGVDGVNHITIGMVETLIWFIAGFISFLYMLSVG